MPGSDAQTTQVQARVQNGRRGLRHPDLYLQVFSTAGVPGSIPAGPEIYAAVLRLLGRREDEVHAVDAQPLR